MPRVERVDPREQAVPQHPVKEAEASQDLAAHGEEHHQLARRLTARCRDRDGDRPLRGRRGSHGQGDHHGLRGPHRDDCCCEAGKEENREDAERDRGHDALAMAQPTGAGTCMRCRRVRETTFTAMMTSTRAVQAAGDPVVSITRMRAPLLSALPGVDQFHE